MSVRVRCSIPPRRRTRLWLDRVLVGLSLTAFGALSAVLFYAYLERP